MGELKWVFYLFGYILGYCDGDLSFDCCDSVSYMLCCVVIDLVFSWGVE